MPRQTVNQIPLTEEEQALVIRLRDLCQQAQERGSDSVKYIWGDWQVAYHEEGISALHRLIKEAEEELG